MKRYQKFLYSLTAAILFIALNVEAASLIVEGRCDIRLEKEGAELLVTGNYTITNLGEDRILSAYPVNTGPSLIWTGEPKDLAPGESFVWSVRSTPAESKSIPPSVAELPTQGIVPIYTTRLYRDTKSYQFSSRDVLLLPSPELAEPLAMKLRNPEITTKVWVISHGESFDGEATVRNLTNSKIKIVPSLVTPVELLIKDLPEVFELEPLAEYQLVFSGTNFSATLGSKYPITLLLQWDSDGIRKAVSAVSYVNIFMNDHAGEFQLSAIIVTCLGILGIILLVRHRRRHRAAE